MDTMTTGGAGQVGARTRELAREVGQLVLAVRGIMIDVENIDDPVERELVCRATEESFRLAADAARTARRAAMKAIYEQAGSYSAVGELTGLSKSRVEQLLR